MQIKRLRVEEGFFDGIDLEFSNGLNVLIGGRGVGKTSIIELIRFGLGVPGLTNHSSSISLAHALAVLQSGQVMIDVSCNGKTFTVIRSSNDDAPRSQEAFKKPLIFSQTEIESVGLNARGRMKLIDSFLEESQEVQNLIYNESVKVKSLTASIANLVKDIDELSDKSRALDDLKKIETELLSKQKFYAEKNKTTEKTQEKLSSLQKQLSDYVVDQENAKSFSQSLSEWRNYIEATIIPPEIPKLSDPDANAELKKIAKEFSEDSSVLHALFLKTNNYMDRISSITEALSNKRLPLEETSRKYRSDIENYHEGAGGVARDLGKVREDIARIKNINEAKINKQETLTELYKQCDEMIESIARSRKDIFDQRKSIVNKLNKKLGPNIQTNIQHLARLDLYEDVIRDTLRGSGLKYNEIAPIIAKRISPQELLLFTQNSMQEEFADALDIPINRAARLLGYLKETDLGDILTAKVEDDIQFALLDGSEYKSIKDLSIGQRCTVALSIVLESDNKILLVDQPEDHLDNEFVADTLIRAIRQRTGNNQTIMSSHNANIPVLGEANWVINLDSNGRRGFVHFANKLESPEIVNAIESLMEGGKEAFLKRAKFYGEEYIT